VALLIGVLTMILPNDKPFTSSNFLIAFIYTPFSLFVFSENWKYQPIVDWTDLSKNFPWGTMILLGAGLSIAHAAKVYLKFYYFFLCFV
jgi:di/tricarboxylate transporter